MTKTIEFKAKEQGETGAMNIDSEKTFRVSAGARYNIDNMSILDNAAFCLSNIFFQLGQA